jgi:hypothetical protein
VGRGTADPQVSDHLVNEDLLTLDGGHKICTCRILAVGVKKGFNNGFLGIFEGTAAKITDEFWTLGTLGGLVSAYLIEFGEWLWFWAEEIAQKV